MEPFQLNPERKSDRLRDPRSAGRRFLRFDTLEVRRVLDGAMDPVVDQPPTGLNTSFESSISENQTGISLGTFEIVDSDGGPSSIDFGGAQGLLTVSGNEVRLVRPQGFNFEQSTNFSFEIRVFGSDLGTPALVRSFTIGITDANDAPIGIDFVGNLKVEEFVPGFEFGTINVSDEDVGEVYAYQFDDPRFEVADGKVKLKAGESLRYAQGAPTLVEVTATGTLSGDVIKDQFSIEVTLSPPPYQNKHWALDVDDDGSVTALDALLVINYLNSFGIGPADTPPPAGSPNFVDVNGDRFITPLDALIIINFLNDIQSQGGFPGNIPGNAPGNAEGEQRLAEGPTPPPSIPNAPSTLNDGAFSLDANDIADTKRRRVIA